MERVRKGVTPREIVYEEDRLKVYHYIGEGEPRFKTPLCFVFALVNRPYIMDLKEGRSIIANYVFPRARSGTFRLNLFSLGLLCLLYRFH
jgi:poly(3-hydroxyalkanoate) synthetase